MRLDLPTPSLSLVRQMPTDPFNVTELRIVVHAGTHLDSSRHYYLDGPAMGEVPLERLCGLRVVWRIPADIEQVIGVAHLAARPTGRQSSPAILRAVCGIGRSEH